jgi:hypothetical protein
LQQRHNDVSLHLELPQNFDIAVFEIDLINIRDRMNPALLIESSKILAEAMIVDFHLHGRSPALTHIFGYKFSFP